VAANQSINQRFLKWLKWYATARATTKTANVVVSRWGANGASQILMDLRGHFEARGRGGKGRKGNKKGRKLTEGREKTRIPPPPK